jgi:hypothetical protein
LEREFLRFCGGILVAIGIGCLLSPLEVKGEHDNHRDCISKERL